MTTLDELLLQNLAKWRTDNRRQNFELVHAASGWKAVLTADTVDALACRLWEVKLARLAPLAGQGTLAERAVQVAARVTGLLEQLRLVEVDAGKDTALLRSVAPQQRGDDRFYYEVMLGGDGAVSLRRYDAPRSTTQRKQVSFTLTHESLAKVAADLTA